MRFLDRHDAGRQLAGLVSNVHLRHPLVLGIARQGVPVAEEVAATLDASLDALVVRRVMVPFDGGAVPIGAVAEGGIVLIDEARAATVDVEPDERAALEQLECQEVERQAGRVRGGLRRLELRGRSVVVVDDLVGSGSTARVACRAVRRSGATAVVLAVPVVPVDWAEEVADEVDAVLSLVVAPEPLSRSAFYANTAEVSDDEVRRVLERAARRTGVSAAARRAR